VYLCIKSAFSREIIYNKNNAREKRVRCDASFLLLFDVRFAEKNKNKKLPAQQNIIPQIKSETDR